MSPNLTPRRAPGQTELPAAERSHRRFPVHLDLRYKVLSGGAPLRGIGVTREFSSTEVKFASDRDLPLGAQIELSLDWPLRLDGVCPLQLMVFGRIMRTDETGTTLTISRYEFRTRGLRTPTASPIRPGVQIIYTRLPQTCRAAVARRE